MLTYSTMVSIISVIESGCVSGDLVVSHRLTADEVRLTKANASRS